MNGIKEWNQNIKHTVTDPPEIGMASKHLQSLLIMINDSEVIRLARLHAESNQNEDELLQGLYKQTCKKKRLIILWKLFQAKVEHERD